MFVRCAFQKCGYCSDNGFCLNRLVVISDQGVCTYLTKPGWDQQIEERFKNTYFPPDFFNTREPVEEIPESSQDMYEDQLKEIWGLD